MEQSDTAICPTCGAEMPIKAEHNGVAWVGHGICSKCGWASQHALPDDFKPNSEADRNDPPNADNAQRGGEVA